MKHYQTIVIKYVPMEADQFNALSVRGKHRKVEDMLTDNEKVETKEGAKLMVRECLKHLLHSFELDSFNKRYYVALDMLIKQFADEI